MIAQIIKAPACRQAGITQINKGGIDEI